MFKFDIFINIILSYILRLYLHFYSIIAIVPLLLQKEI